MTLDALRAFITANPISAAALASLWGAVLIDLTAFAATKDPGDFVGQFNTSKAIWRYVQALVAGFVGNFAVATVGAVVVAAVVWLW